MQRLFITGGTGFFGKSILDYRLRHPDFLADAELTILSRDPNVFVAANPELGTQAGVHFVQGLRSKAHPLYVFWCHLWSPDRRCERRHAGESHDIIKGIHSRINQLAP